MLRGDGRELAKVVDDPVRPPATGEGVRVERGPTEQPGRPWLLEEVFLLERHFGSGLGALRPL